MDIDIEQLRRGIEVGITIDDGDVCVALPDGVRVADRCSEVTVRVQDGACHPAVHPVAEIAEAMERAHNERRKQALRDLDAAHKRVRAKLREERARSAELERELARERDIGERLACDVGRLRARDETIMADELERALNTVLTEAWRASRRALRDAGKGFADVDRGGENGD